MIVWKLQKPCESDVTLERLPPSWRSILMVSISISIDTNDVWIPLVGLEEASCKACTAGFTCADTRKALTEPSAVAARSHAKSSW